MKCAYKLFQYAASIMLMMTSVAIAAGDAINGEKLAKKCKTCHTLEEGGKNRLGPNLFDILDKPAGKVEGYKYSDAMLASGITWDIATFTDFITKPKKVVNGTKMSFGGIKNAAKRADLLAYFETLRSNSSGQANIANAAAGKLVAANHCAVCHTFEEGGKVIFGPNLFDMYGKPAGAIEGYAYSEAMLNSGLVWGDVNLDGFLSNPEQFLRGSKARFPGLKSAQQRADIIAYLKSLK